MNKKVLPLPLDLLLLLLTLDSPVQLVGFLPFCDVDNLLLHFWPPESLIVYVLDYEVANFSFQVVLLCLVLFELSIKFFLDFFIVYFFLCWFLLGTTSQIIKVCGRHVRVL